MEWDLGRQPLSETELEGRLRGRDPREFLNTCNALYRSRNMKQRPPSAAETIRLMAGRPNLIRRPIVVRGCDRVLVFDEVGLNRLLRLSG